MKFRAQALDTRSTSAAVFSAVANLDASEVGRHADGLFADVAYHAAVPVSIADRARIAPRYVSGAARSERTDFAGLAFEAIGMMCAL